LKGVPKSSPKPNASTEATSVVYQKNFAGAVCFPVQFPFRSPREGARMVMKLPRLKDFKIEA
jgi:hypothetical protein